MGSARVAEPSTGPPPWLFGVFSAPYGSFTGLVGVALPYLFRRQGMAVGRIATISAIVQAPAILYVLWSPAVDVGLRRRTWLVLLSVTGAACATVALARLPTAGVVFTTTLFFVASVVSQTVSSAVGGLVAAVVPNAVRGRTGGWSQAGMLTGGVATGGLTIWLSGHASMWTTALAAGALIALPAFAVMAVHEPAPPQRRLAHELGAVARDIRATLRRREVRVGLVYFLSPVGAGALSNLFSAVAREYHARPGVVIWIVGLAAVLTPVGALVGGFVCDRFDRWLVYPLAALTAASSAVCMAAAPLTPVTYVTGAASYALTLGFCYAAFMALAFQLVGPDTAASATRFSLFMAAVNVPVVYMTRLDGWGYTHFGVRGMLLVDGLSNALFGVVFLLARSNRRAPRSG